MWGLMRVAGRAGRSSALGAGRIQQGCPEAGSLGSLRPWQRPRALRAKKMHQQWVWAERLRRISSPRQSPPDPGPLPLEAGEGVKQRRLGRPAPSPLAPLPGGEGKVQMRALAGSRACS